MEMQGTSRFESKGEISLSSLLFLVQEIDCLSDFNELFKALSYDNYN